MFHRLDRVRANVEGLCAFTYRPMFLARIRIDTVAAHEFDGIAHQQPSQLDTISLSPTHSVSNDWA